MIFLDKVFYFIESLLHFNMTPDEKLIYNRLSKKDLLEWNYNPYDYQYVKSENKLLSEGKNEFQIFLGNSLYSGDQVKLGGYEYLELNSTLKNKFPKGVVFLSYIKYNKGGGSYALFSGKEKKFKQSDNLEYGLYMVYFNENGRMLYYRLRHRKILKRFKEITMYHKNIHTESEYQNIMEKLENTLQ